MHSMLANDNKIIPLFLLNQIRAFLSADKINSVSIDYRHKLFTSFFHLYFIYKSFKMIFLFKCYTKILIL